MISVVIPVLNEAVRLEGLLDALEAQEGEAELIVVDGGSRDATLSLAGGRARLLTAPPGRAGQMNAGATAASGEILLFLHSDTRLPAGAFGLIEEAMRDPGAVGGGFLHRFDRDDWFSRFISLSANTRTRLCRLFFGDQAIFVRREVFERLGGYADMPLFEDWDFTARLRKEGRVVFIRRPIETSGRRIDAWGKRKAFAIWWGFSILYALGVSPERLARYYGDIR